jgi:hypothetical protein
MLKEDIMSDLKKPELSVAAMRKCLLNMYAGAWHNEDSQPDPVILANHLAMCQKGQEGIVKQVYREVFEDRNKILDEIEDLRLYWCEEKRRRRIHNYRCNYCLYGFDVEDYEDYKDYDDDKLLLPISLSYGVRPMINDEWLEHIGILILGEAERSAYEVQTNIDDEIHSNEEEERRRVEVIFSEIFRIERSVGEERMVIIGTFLWYRVELINRNESEDIDLSLKNSKYVRMYNKYVKQFKLDHPEYIKGKKGYCTDIEF